MTSFYMRLKDAACYFYDLITQETKRSDKVKWITESTLKRKMSKEFVRRTDIYIEKGKDHLKGKPYVLVVQKCVCRQRGKVDCVFLSL